MQKKTKTLNRSSLARHELVAGAARLHGEALAANKYQRALCRVIYGLLIRCDISSTSLFFFHRGDLVQSLYVGRAAGATVLANY